MADVCVITGGFRGIGRATAIKVAKQGINVVLAGLPEHEDDGEQVRSECTAAGVRAVCVTSDLSSEKGTQYLFSRVDAEFGRIDWLVNAAGMSHHSAVEEFQWAKLERLFSVNVLAVMMCCKEGVTRMLPSNGGNGGSIVNISSMSATIGGRPGASAYAATKGAIDVFTVGLAKEVAAQGIRANTVRPGVIRTTMTENLQHDEEMLRQVEESIPLGRIGEPDEIAEVAIWLLSEQASLVTGACVNAGGGGFHVAGNR